MHRAINSTKYEIRFDTAFEEVITSCANTRRKGQYGTWITNDMVDAYTRLYKQNIAHSIEVWMDDTLAGGLYGVAAGKVFCAESMFSKYTNTSKLALIALCQSHKYELIDCQVYTPHLESMGAKFMSRNEFIARLQGIH
jgi:leucyl/phenylalanyl-tRNA--protein transferase